MLPCDEPREIRDSSFNLVARKHVRAGKMFQNMRTRFVVGLLRLRVIQRRDVEVIREVEVMVVRGKKPAPVRVLKCLEFTRAKLRRQGSLPGHRDEPLVGFHLFQNQLKLASVGIRRGSIFLLITRRTRTRVVGGCPSGSGTRGGSPSLGLGPGGRTLLLRSGPGGGSSGFVGPKQDREERMGLRLYRPSEGEGKVFWKWQHVYCYLIS